MVQLLESVHLVIKANGKQILSLKPATLHTYWVERALLAIDIVCQRIYLRNLLRTALGLNLTNQLTQNCNILLANNASSSILYRHKVVDNHTTCIAIAHTEVCLLYLNT